MTKVTHLTTDERGGLNRRRIHLREISGDAETPLETVGQDLRAARLRRGDDLATVSRALKIRKDHIEAIEEDRLESLPGRTYAVGFVRSYSDYLGLDAVETVERFKNEIAGRGEPNAGHEIALSTDTDERQLPHGWIVIAVVLLVVVAYGAYRLARSADTLLKAPVAPVPTNIVPQPVFTKLTKPAPPPAPSNQVAPSAATPSGTSNPAAPPATGASKGSQPQAVPAPSGQVAGQAAQQGPPPATQPPNPQVAAIPSAQEYGVQNKDARVILRAKTMTRVLVQGADGTVFINRVLRPGDSYRVPDKVGLTLTTPDGGAVALELDGQEMGTAGQQGQVTEAVSLDPQAIVDRYNGGAGQ